MIAAIRAGFRILVGLRGAIVRTGRQRCNCLSRSRQNRSGLRALAGNTLLRSLLVRWRSGGWYQGRMPLRRCIAIFRFVCSRVHRNGGLRQGRHRNRRKRFADDRAARRSRRRRRQAIGRNDARASSVPGDDNAAVRDNRPTLSGLDEALLLVPFQRRTKMPGLRKIQKRSKKQTEVNPVPFQHGLLDSDVGLLQDFRILTADLSPMVAGRLVRYQGRQLDVE